MRRTLPCVWNFGFVLLVVFGLTACLPKLYIKQSFREAVSLPVVNGTIALERGETIELKEIFKAEKQNPEKIVLTRLFGTYIITADGFKNIWMLYPANKEAASYKPIEPPFKGGIQTPQFEHSVSHDCVTLTINGSDRWNIHASGKIARKCDDLPK